VESVDDVARRAGASMPYHEVTLYTGTPEFAMVGTSGSGQCAWRTWEWEI
jgi:hypothetical protein